MSAKKTVYKLCLCSHVKNDDIALRADGILLESMAQIEELPTGTSTSWTFWSVTTQAATAKRQKSCTSLPWYSSEAG